MPFKEGALAALLVPAPASEIIACIKAILPGHNQLEEGEGGLYETCDRLAGDEFGMLLRLSSPIIASKDLPAVINFSSSNWHFCR